MDSNNVWHYLLTVAITVLGGLVTIIGWLLKGKIKAYDKHLEDCRETAVRNGRADERLASVESEVKGMRKTMNWVGDSMLILGTSMKVRLPGRPES